MRRARPLHLAIALLVAGTLAACGGGDLDDDGQGGEPDQEQEPDDVATDDDAATDDEVEDEVPSDVPDALRAQVDAAIDDLAAEAGVDASEVEVVSAQRVTWSDGSRGCPQPDQMYTMALVEGYRIVLAVDGDEVHYHGGEGETPFRCDDPAPPADAGA
ncbi:hypothetical protein FTX61_08040 [Nitriliruptoraceae bacterium ZYF776]|nr:hypothetical protein [Profundirhabdus halotolerans]